MGRPFIFFSLKFNAMSKLLDRLWAKLDKWIYMYTVLAVWFTLCLLYVLLACWHIHVHTMQLLHQPLEMMLGNFASNYDG